MSYQLQYWQLFLQTILYFKSKGNCKNVIDFEIMINSIQQSDLQNLSLFRLTFTSNKT